MRTARSVCDRRMRSHLIRRSSRSGWNIGPRPRRTRTFLAQRQSGGAWRRITYARDARPGAPHRRGAARSGIFRRSGRSSSSPATISSMRCSAWRANFVGIPYAPISPAYSLVSRTSASCATFSICSRRVSSLWPMATPLRARSKPSRRRTSRSWWPQSDLEPAQPSFSRHLRGIACTVAVDAAHATVRTGHHREIPVHLRLDRRAEGA